MHACYYLIFNCHVVLPVPWSPSLNFLFHFVLLLLVFIKFNISTAAWLAQLVECRTAVREVKGSSPRPDQHSGS